MQINKEAMLMTTKTEIVIYMSLSIITAFFSTFTGGRGRYYRSSSSGGPKDFSGGGGSSRGF